MAESQMLTTEMEHAVALLDKRTRRAILETVAHNHSDWHHVHRYQFARFWFLPSALHHAAILLIDPRGELSPLWVRTKWRDDTDCGGGIRTYTKRSGLFEGRFDDETHPATDWRQGAEVGIFDAMSLPQYRARVKKPGDPDRWIKSGYSYYAKHAGFFKADDMLSRHVFHYWHARELSRFDAKYYTPLNAAVWQACAEHLGPRVVSAMRMQFPHASIRNPDHIAYTPTTQHGYDDRQITLSPGKYFAQFCDDDKLVQRLAECHRLGVLPEPPHVELIVNNGDGHGDEIYSTYRIIHNRFGACMSHETDDYRCYPHSPVDAYGPDMACAVAVENGDYIARAIVSTKTLKYWRVYGANENDRNKLTSALVEMGYSRDSDWMDGHRMYRHCGDGENRFAMPYTDGNSYNVFDDGEYLWLSLGESFNHPVTGDRLALVGRGTNETNGLPGRIIACTECGTGIGDDYVRDCNGEFYHSECTDSLAWIERYSEWYPVDECVYSECQDQYIPESSATSLDAGEYAGDYCWDCDTIELHDGSDAYEHDDEVVTLKNGDYAVMEDCVEDIDGEFILACDATEIDDGYVLTASLFNGMYMPDVPAGDFAGFYYRGFPAGITSRVFTIVGIEREPRPGYIDWQTLCYITTQGNIDNAVQLRDIDGGWVRTLAFADAVMTQTEMEV